MQYKHHTLFGLVFAFVIWILFPQVNFLSALIIFFSSVLIDIDHFLFYVFKEKDTSLSLRKAVDWFLKQTKSPKPFSTIFHSVEFLLILAILSFYSKIVFFIFLGFVFHLITDIVFLYIKGDIHLRRFSFLLYFMTRKEPKNDLERTYFILIHKKHRREVYFQNTAKAIDFLKVKFPPYLKRFKTIKRLIYFLIKIRLLQPFLETIELPVEFGDVIFIANQVKCFDLDKKVVISFPKNEDKESFIKSKELQRELAKEGFAPEILELNYEIPFSKEELLKPYGGDNDGRVFKKLFSFYQSQGIDGGITTIHGSFTREQVLIKDNYYVFIDWGDSRKSFIFEDLINFYRDKIQNE